MSSSVVEQDIRAIVDELGGLLQHLSGSTLLVTGGTGFLCSYFLDTVTYLNDHVWRRACRMICVDNLKSSAAARIAHLLPRRDFLFIQHDISNRLRFEERID